jgi:hypothetical protein
MGERCHTQSESVPRSFAYIAHGKLYGSNAFLACFVRPVFAMIHLSFTAGSGSGLPLTVQKGTPAKCGLLGEIKGLHLEVSDQHK